MSEYRHGVGRGALRLGDAEVIEERRVTQIAIVAVLPAPIQILDSESISAEYLKSHVRMRPLFVGKDKEHRDFIV